MFPQHQKHIQTIKLKILTVAEDIPITNRTVAEDIPITNRTVALGQTR
jgi:hypothetical protein